MRKSAFLSFFLAATCSTFLTACGGGSSDTVGIFESSIIYIEGLEGGSYIRSDIARIVCVDEDNRIEDLDFEPTNIQAILRMEPVKKADGTPVTQNPSPVLFTRYKISFSPLASDNNCERNQECKQLLAGGIEGFVGFTLYLEKPDTPTRTIVEVLAIPASWKSQVLSMYCSSTDDNCLYNGIIEFYGKEVFGGKERIVRSAFIIEFADFRAGDDEPCPEQQQNQPTP